MKTGDAMKYTCLLSGICVQLFILFCTGCAGKKPSGDVLASSSALFASHTSVSIPLLRINVESGRGEKKKNLTLTGQVISEWPDKLRMKIRKANYHLLSMVVNGHKASLFFPRTDKVFNTGINRPVLEKGKGADLLSAVIEMSLMFIHGPFPQYALSLYTLKGIKGDVCSYTADLPEYSLEIAVHASTYRVLKQVYRFKKPHDWVMAVEFGRYSVSRGSAPYPQKITVSVCKEKASSDKTVIEMFVSKVSFGRDVSPKAFKTNWPENAVEIERLPEDHEKLFGKIEEEKRTGSQDRQDK